MTAYEIQHTAKGAERSTSVKIKANNVWEAQAKFEQQVHGNIQKITVVRK
jgi:hypothetical protein